MPETGESPLASESESVGSCESMIHSEHDILEEMELSDLYTNTQIGRCLQTVLSEMLDEGEIDIRQCHAIRKRFNRIHSEAYAQCSNRLHLTVSGHLSEFNCLSSGSTFQIDECKLTAPSSSVQVPRGTIKLAHALGALN
jgi:hypothetical protein